MNNSVYVTKEVATQECKDFAEKTPGAVFENLGLCKQVRDASGQLPLWFQKVTADTARAHPELKGLYRKVR